jgi:nucleotide-binding universal stress UspA family protein
LVEPISKLKHILVSLEGNGADHAVMDLAIRMAKPAKAHVSAVHIIEVKRALPLEAEIPTAIEKGEAALQRAEQWAKQAGVDIEIEILQARDAGAALVDEAVDRAVDLILIGVPYRTRFGSFDLGGVATYALRKAPCRVWVLREPIPS